MKAKEYAERYRTAKSPNDELVEIARDFILEIKTIAEQRKAKKDMAIVKIVREQEQKWEAFCRHVNDPNVRTDGFMRLFKAQLPELAAAVLAAEIAHEEDEKWRKRRSSHFYHDRDRRRG
jgi:hypothetical protein